MYNKLVVKHKKIKLAWKKKNLSYTFKYINQQRSVFD